jgi:hypothetical protein
MLGLCREVAFPNPAPLADLLRFLMEQEPALKPYAGFGPRDVQPYGLLVWRGGEFLTLSDTVNPTDELEMIPMVAGG